MFTVQRRGNDTFIAGDLLAFKLEFDSNFIGITNNWQVLCSVQFDT
jgi:hypothetical protein